MLSLSQAQKSRSYIIKEITANAKTKKRLHSLGIVVDQKITAVYFSAFRRNILLLCASAFIGLRMDLACNIMVAEIE